MKYLLTLMFFFTLLISVYSQNYKQVKIYANDKSDYAVLQSAGLEIDHGLIGKDNSLTVFLSDEQFLRLQSTSFKYDILIADWFDYYAKQPKLTESEKAFFIQQSKENYGVEGFGFGSMGGFYTLDEVYAQLDSMYAHYPNIITQKFSIGNSLEGRPIYAVKISDNPNVNENEPQVYYNSLIHAREPQGMMTVIYYMYYLLENYGTDPEVTYLVNNREIYFQPVVNPDGYEYNRSTNPNGGGMFRKNRRLNSNGSRGVDLNRNFGYMWGYNNIGSSNDPSDETYRGTAAFSEPETQVMRDFVNSKSFKTTLNYHTYSNLLLYPWSYVTSPTADNSTFAEFSSDMVAYNGYENGQPSVILYEVNGSSDDWMYGEQTSKPKIFAMTPEVGETGFWPSQSEIFPLAIENLKPNLYYTWVAGEFVKLVNSSFSLQYINPGDYVELSIPQLRNKGLSDASNVSLTLTSNNPLVTINNGNISIGNIVARTTFNNSQKFSFTLDSGIPISEKIKMIVTVFTGSTPMYADTLSFDVGTPEYLFCDNFTNLNNWAVVGTVGTGNWSVNNSSNAGGTAPELRLSWSPSFTGLSKLRSTSVSLPNNQSVFYSFNFYFDWYSNPSGVVTLAATYDNGVTSTPIYTLSNPTSNIGPELITGSFTTPSSGAENTKFEISYNGYTFNIDYIYWDNMCFYLMIPVELTSFNASVSKNEVRLNWSTATETNNSGFEIQRKVLSLREGLGEAWEKIGFVAGYGTTTENKSYQFTDSKLSTGNYTYRLKQIDYDGSSKYSNTVNVNIEGVKEYALEQNFPNPFNPTTEINFSLAIAGYTTLKIYNILGAEVAALVNGFMEAGSHSVQFNGSDLTSGVYFYTIKSNNFSSTKKMLLMR